MNAGSLCTWTWGTSVPIFGSKLLWGAVGLRSSCQMTRIISWFLVFFFPVCLLWYHRNVEYPWDDGNLWVLLVIPVAGYCGHFSLFTIYCIASHSCLVMHSVLRRLETDSESSCVVKCSCQVYRRWSQSNWYFVSCGIHFPRIQEASDSHHSDFKAVSVEILKPVFSRAVASFCLWQAKFSISIAPPIVPASLMWKMRWLAKIVFKMSLCCIFPTGGEIIAANPEWAAQLHVYLATKCGE